MSAGPETRLVARIIAAAFKRYGRERLLLEKTHGSAYSRTGTADLIGCLDGRYVAIEVKAPRASGETPEHARERVTLAQRTFLVRVHEAGGVAGVALSVEDALDLLDEQGDSRCSVQMLWPGLVGDHQP